MTMHEWLDGTRNGFRQSAEPEAAKAIAMLRDARRIALALRDKNFVEALAVSKAFLQRLDQEI